MSVVRRSQLRRQRERQDERCKACWDAKVPWRLALAHCPACQERFDRAHLS